MPWLFSSILASLSFAAAAVSLWCSFRVLRALRGASLRSLATLSMEVAELTCVSESHAGQIKRLSARVGMREVRQRREDQGETGSESLGDKHLDRAKLKEIARARGFKLS